MSCENALIFFSFIIVFSVCIPSLKLVATNKSDGANGNAIRINNDVHRHISVLVIHPKCLRKKKIHVISVHTFGLVLS